MSEVNLEEISRVVKEIDESVKKLHEKLEDIENKLGIASIEALRELNEKVEKLRKEHEESIVGLAAKLAELRTDVTAELRRLKE